MIELAPHNPNGLSLKNPVIVAPGCAAALTRDQLAVVGAVATRTATLRAPREAGRRWQPVPAGVVFQRLPTTSLRTLVSTEARRWVRSPVPVVLSVRGTAGELAQMAAQLELVEGVAALLIEVEDDPLASALTAVRAQTLLPLLLSLPPTADVAAHASESVPAGADALVVCAYPPAVAVDDAPFEGLLVGPALVPLTLRALFRVRESVDVPLVASGGAADARIARQYLAMGAQAVMVDGALYGDPFAAQRIAAELERKT